MIRWGWLAAGLAAVALVTIAGILLTNPGQNSDNGVWLVAFLPLAGVVAGAVLLAGREPS